MKIPFIDLKKQFRLLEKDMREALDRVLEHGQFIMGPEIVDLETELARYVGSKHAISCASGTDALLLPLLAKGVGPGDAIFTSPFTFIATAEVISLLGATPVFVDIDPRTYNIDPVKLAETIQKVSREGHLRPVGIIPVDLFGLPADYDPIMALADEMNLFVIEDAAQAFGGRYKGRIAGNLGHIGATSFFPSKPLGCYGDGGAVFVNDDDLAAKMKSIRIHGQGSNKYENVRIGVNARMDTLQAAITLVKLSVFPKELEARQRVASGYSQRLKDYVRIPYVPEGYLSAWAQYSILTERRAEIIEDLKMANIPTAIYYPTPLHLQKAFSGLGYSRGDFPVSENVAEGIFSLPMHPYLEDDEMNFIVEHLLAAINRRN